MIYDSMAVRAVERKYIAALISLGWELLKTEAGVVYLRRAFA